MPDSQVKLRGSEFHMLNVFKRNMCFKFKMEDLQMEIDFTYEIYLSHMELKHFHI